MRGLDKLPHPLVAERPDERDRAGRRQGHVEGRHPVEPAAAIRDQRLPALILCGKQALEQTGIDEGTIGQPVIAGRRIPLAARFDAAFVGIVARLFRIISGTRRRGPGRNHRLVSVSETMVASPALETGGGATPSLWRHKVLAIEGCRTQDGPAADRPGKPGDIAMPDDKRMHAWPPSRIGMKAEPTRKDRRIDDRNVFRSRLQTGTAVRIQPRFLPPADVSRADPGCGDFRCGAP